MIDYKKNYEENVEKYKKMGYEVPKPDMIKTEADIEGIRRAGVINNLVLDEVAKHIHAGMSTEEINTIVHEKTLELDKPYLVNLRHPKALVEFLHHLIMKDSQRVYVHRLMMQYVMVFLTLL
jgi:hypothetical protein